MGEIGVDAPVVTFVGVGQSASGDSSMQAGVIQLRSHRSQTRFDVPQTFAVGQLRECHAEELVEARETTISRVAPVATNALVEFVPWKEIHQLSKNELPVVHSPPPSPPKRARNGYSLRLS